jgi:hypothetical membrane protein
MQTYETYSVYAGYAAALISLPGVLLATVLSPTFTWSGNALSNLGKTGHEAATTLTVVTFNGGLVVGSLFGIGFAYALLRYRRNRGELLGGVVLALSFLALGMVGVFPQGTDLHFPSALSFYGLLSVGLWLYGAGNLLAGARRLGAITVVMGVVNILAWVGWTLTGSLLRDGLAIPEIVGATLLAVWVIGTASRLRELQSPGPV